MNLYLLQYNNYYNRILKRETTFADYQRYSTYEPILGIKNFSYADGVSTRQTANIDDAFITENGMPDYAIAVDDNMNILYRYFIIDAVFQCKGQYVLTLYKDLVADFYDDILNAPIFFEKAPLSENDPFIFNKEDMTFNQIKKDEQTLQDNFVTPWIIGYMGTTNKTTTNPNTQQEETEEYSFTFKRKIRPDYTVTTRDMFASVSGVSEGDKRVLQDWGFQVYGNAGGGGLVGIDYKWTMSFNSNGTMETKYPGGTEFGYSEEIGTSNSALNLSSRTSKSVQKVLDKYISEIGGNEENMYLISQQVGMEGEDAWTAAVNERNKIVYVSEEGKYYKVNVKTDIVWGTYQAVSGTDIWQKLVNVSDIVRSGTSLRKYANVEYNNETFGYLMKYKRARVELVAYEGVPVEPKEIKIPLGRNVLQDAPYCMFAIPFYDNRSFYRDGLYQFGSTSSDVVLNFVSDMSAGLKGANILWDIQLLPYCPMQNRLKGSRPTYFDITGMAENADYQFIEIDATYHIGIPIFWCQQSTFSFNIDHEIVNPYQEIKIGNVIYKEGKPWPKKIWNEVSMYRLCSPNYASAFEFSAAKNNGVFSFNIDCSYKPFQPYIHVNPNFDGLYGKDFDDARGLICAGDFSLTQLNDAWETYQRQNTNFQNTFDRQIENMETINKYQKMEEQINALVGVIGAGAAGAALGKNLGSPIAGAVVGGTASLAAGIADIAINDRLRAEALDFTKDQFAYSLGNIQALPQTISKLSAFTANNKIFPVLEVYLPTDQEVEALCYKLGYNGMTVMRIGTLNEFILNKTDPGKYGPTGRNYFKGKLIQLDFPMENGEYTKTEDFHIINALSAELYKGLYI